MVDTAALRRNAEAANRSATWWSEHSLRYHLRVSDGTCPEEDPAFIAAANPAAILALLDELDALRAQQPKCGSECDYVCQQPDGFGWCGKRASSGVRAVDLPDLPEALVMVRDTDDEPEGGGWIVDCDCEGPLSYSLEAGEALYTADQMREYARAALGVKEGQPAPLKVDDQASLRQMLELVAKNLDKGLSKSFQRLQARSIREVLDADGV
jgi:hypothetical protein